MYGSKRQVLTRAPVWANRLDGVLDVPFVISPSLSLYLTAEQRNNAQRTTVSKAEEKNGHLNCPPLDFAAFHSKQPTGSFVITTKAIL